MLWLILSSLIKRNRDTRKCLLSIHCTSCFTVAKGSGFAIEALAGLASKENFSKIELRKTESTGSGSGNTRHDPYLPLMLIHIKGNLLVYCKN